MVVKLLGCFCTPSLLSLLIHIPSASWYSSSSLCCASETACGSMMYPAKNLWAMGVFFITMSPGHLPRDLPEHRVLSPSLWHQGRGTGRSGWGCKPLSFQPWDSQCPGSVPDPQPVPFQYRLPEPCRCYANRDLPNETLWVQTNQHFSELCFIN